MSHFKIFPAGMAEMTAKRAGEKYRPSNGTEGDLFISGHCYHCIDGGHSCDILYRTLEHDVEDPEYPSEWQYGTDGQPTCTAFRRLDEEEVTKVRCKHTVDMFEVRNP